jgi:hypothetical protein
MISLSQRLVLTIALTFSVSGALAAAEIPTVAAERVPMEAGVRIVQAVVGERIVATTSSGSSSRTRLGKGC